MNIIYLWYDYNCEMGDDSLFVFRGKFFFALAQYFFLMSVIIMLF